MARGASTNRAIPEDVMAKALSYLSLPDGWQAASACKTYRACWRRRCRGMLRVARERIGRFSYIDHLTALSGGDGIIVPHYGEHRLEIYSPEVVHRGTCAGRQFRHVEDGESWTSDTLQTPSAVALRGDGTAWVILKDEGEVACVRLGAVISEHIMLIETDCFMPVDLALAGDRLLVLSCEYPSLGRVYVLDNQTGAQLSTFGSTGESWRDELRGPSCLAVHEQYCFIADTHNQAVKVFDWREGTLVRVFGKRQDDPWDVKTLMTDAFMTPEPVSYHEFRDDYYDLRKGDGPGEFNLPLGVAVRDGKLYVSELEGRRIQVFRLPDDMHGSDLELLQIIPSPDGWPLSGLCVDDAGRLWCVGPGVSYTGGYTHEHPGHNADYVFDDGPSTVTSARLEKKLYRHISCYLHIFEPVFK
uniref:F-box domain-containing protein n=1 Tax=Pelagomonas calceolata TaxID=35677 RepID=A0A7S4EBS1_9STRA